MIEIYLPTECNPDKESEFRQKLTTIGLTRSDYETAIGAIESVDLDLLQRINTIAESRVGNRSNLISPVTTQTLYRDSATGEYDPSREEIHRDIIEQILAPIERTENPRFHVMAGSPGVGKTAGLYLYEYSKNAVLTDPTLIQKILTLGFDESNYTQVLETKDESFDIAEKLIDEAFKRGLAITSESTLQNLPWATKALQEAERRGYESHIIFFHRNLADCFRDAIENRKRPVTINYLLKSIQGYENLTFFDKFPGLKVTVIDKRIPDTWKIVYEGTDGTLGNNDEFTEIKNSLEVFKPIIIR